MKEGGAREEKAGAGGAKDARTARERVGWGSRHPYLEVVGVLAGMAFIMAAYYAASALFGQCSRDWCKPLGVEGFPEFDDLARCGPVADALPGRTLWFFVTAVNWLVCLATAVVAFLLLLSASRGYKKPCARAFKWLGVFLAAAASVGAFTTKWAWLPHAPDAKVYVPLLFQALRQTAQTDVTSVVAVTVWSVGASYAAAVLLALVSCVIIWPPQRRRQTALELARRMRLLRTLLYFGTVVLVVVSLRIATELDWAASIYEAWNPAPAEPKGAAVHGVEVIKKFFSANTTVQAATNTLMLASVYLPAALILRARAHELVAKTFGARGTPADREKWMQERGLSLSASEYLPRAAAILAPLLAGPIGDLIGKLAK